MLYSFNDGKAPNRKKRQYYEMFGNRAMWVDGWKAVTLHAKRMPWALNVILPFEQDRLFGDQKEFVYYAPGAVRIAEKASAPVKNRSHTITTTIDLKGYEEGVIVAIGGMTGGFTMFIKGGRLYYDYNYLDGLYYTLASAPLPEGRTELKFNFIKTREFGGTDELYVNGKKVSEHEMPQMHISAYSLAETFDIGRDTGTQVSRLYDGPFPFVGKLDRVIITLTD